MANLAKFTAQETGKMLAHYSREQDEKGIYITYPRSEGGAGHIDREKTNRNFTIGQIRDENWISERLNGVYQKPNQKKPIRMCDIVVTLPRNEAIEYTNCQKFFKATYDSLSRLYGKNNNIVGAWVHLDEAQPHMHFAFLPISKRNSKQKPELKEKLSTRAYWSSKSSLSDMHKVLEVDISRDLGRKVNITNGAVKDQGGFNKTIEQLKAETEKATAEVEKIRERSRKLLSNDVSEEIKYLEADDNHIRAKGGLLRHAYYELSEHAFKRLKTLATRAVIVKEDIAKLQEKNDYLESQLDVFRNENREQREEIDDLREELYELKKVPYFKLPQKAREYLDLDISNFLKEEAKKKLIQEKPTEEISRGGR